MSTFTAPYIADRIADTAQTVPVNRIAFNIRHETLEDDVKRQTRLIEPSVLPTLITVKSEIAATGAKALRSPAYLASVRRRWARNIAKNVADLEAQALRDDFAVATFPIVTSLRKVLTDILVDAENEGNAREILRRLRDTFLNGGWN